MKSYCLPLNDDSLVNQIRNASIEPIKETPKISTDLPDKIKNDAIIDSETHYDIYDLEIIIIN